MSDAPNDFSLLIRKAGLEAATGAADPEPIREQQPVLNGVPYRTFRQSEDLIERRQQGTFFSGAELANEVVRLLRSKVSSDALVMDPTCGIGDLLLAYAETLPLWPTLKETLACWGERLSGIEVRADLVDMAKARLVTLARFRGGFRDPLERIDTVFPLIVVGDMFDQAEMIGKADGFLFNPPFGQTSSHDVTEWGSGLINAAALFLEVLMQVRRPGAPIAAVLPEVLRCGTRYARFRARLSQAGLGGSFTSMGRFDPWTDVDVFTTLLEDCSAPSIWQSEKTGTESRGYVGDLFEVRVGPVVPHRHPNRGPWHRFACAKTVPAWVTDYIPKRSRRFEGTTFTPPFVVVRRTSSPSDKKRAVGAIILGQRSVAVENHLIVLLPKDGSLEKCMELLKVLSRNATSEYLNRVIRCRHLTKASVLTIPWTSVDE